MKKRVKKISLPKTYSPKMILFWVLAFATIGLLTLLITKAASPTISAEPEKGLLAGSISAITDTNASGNQYVQFGLSSSGNNSVTGGTDNSCVFQKADKPTHIAFCEGF